MYNAIDKAIALNTNPSTFDVDMALADWSVWLTTWQLERDVQDQLYDCFITGDLEMEDFTYNTSCMYQTLSNRPGHRNVVTVVIDNNVPPAPNYQQFVERVQQDQPIDPEWDWWFSTQTLEDYREQPPVASTPIKNPIRYSHRVPMTNLCRL